MIHKRKKAICSYNEKENLTFSVCNRFLKFNRRASVAFFRSWIANYKSKRFLTLGKEMNKCFFP